MAKLDTASLAAHCIQVLHNCIAITTGTRSASLPRSAQSGGLQHQRDAGLDQSEHASHTVLRKCALARARARARLQRTSISVPAWITCCERCRASSLTSSSLTFCKPSTLRFRKHFVRPSFSDACSPRMSCSAHCNEQNWHLLPVFAVAFTRFRPK
jgi:hypothetical protein